MSETVSENLVVIDCISCKHRVMVQMDDLSPKTRCGECGRLLSPEMPEETNPTGDVGSARRDEPDSEMVVGGSVSSDQELDELRHRESRQVFHRAKMELAAIREMVAGQMAPSSFVSDIIGFPYRGSARERKGLYSCR